VALARAVVTEPRVLLLDEPLAALDQNLREEMQVELGKLQRRLGLTTVMVTHDQREAIVLSDRIAVMRAGKVEQLGSPLEIHDQPRTRYVARFCGVENLLPVKVLGGTAIEVAGTVLHGNCGGADRTISDATLAVRAEAVAVAARSAEPGEIAGVVSFVQILGAAVRYEIAAAGATVVAIEPRRDAPPLAPGTKVAAMLPRGRWTLLTE
jgi:ABC-type Fe3+/spermidine/putrescine transport system ATPase subunit